MMDRHRYLYCIIETQPLGLLLGISCLPKHFKIMPKVEIILKSLDHEILTFGNNYIYFQKSVESDLYEIYFKLVHVL